MDIIDILDELEKIKKDLIGVEDAQGQDWEMIKSAIRKTEALIESICK